MFAAAATGSAGGAARRVASRAASTVLDGACTRSATHPNSGETGQGGADAHDAESEVHVGHVVTVLRMWCVLGQASLHKLQYLVERALEQEVTAIE